MKKLDRELRAVTGCWELACMISRAMREKETFVYLNGPLIKEELEWLQSGGYLVWGRMISWNPQLNRIVAKSKR